MKRPFLIIGMAVSLTTVLVAALPDSDRTLDAEAPSASEATVYKLGGVHLPYVGDGSLEYDGEAQEWIVAFAAPPDWECTHVGWAFPAANVPSGLPLEDKNWRAQGTLDVMVAEGVLYVSVWTERAVHDFEFVYSDALNDPTADFRQIDDRLDWVGFDGDPMLERDRECPGGECQCLGKCDACCPSGFYPHCNCHGLGTCLCRRRIAIPPSGSSSEAMFVLNYDVNGF